LEPRRAPPRRACRRALGHHGTHALVRGAPLVQRSERVHQRGRSRPPGAGRAVTFGVWAAWRTGWPESQRPPRDPVTGRRATEATSATVVLHYIPPPDPVLPLL